MTFAPAAFLIGAGVVAAVLSIRGGKKRALPAVLFARRLCLGVSPGHGALVVGFIFPFDRPLDMMRTVGKVTGKAAVATSVARRGGELGEAVFRARPAA